MQAAWRSYRMIVACLAVVVAGFGLLVLDVRAEESLADFEARVEEAFAAAETALASEEARLDELAERHSRRGLADGRPSVAQASANVRLWERRIRELGAGKRALRGELDGVLGALDTDIAALAQRLSEQGKKARRERAEREAAVRQAREQARRERAERKGAQSEKAADLVFRDCPHCPDMIVVPPGNFLMGSSPDEEGRSDNEGPQYRVEIAEPFAVGVHEVTRGEFGRFVSSTDRAMGNSCWIWDGKWQQQSGINWRNPGFSQGDDHPAVCVSWNDAAAYVRWLSQETGKAYRLLSEAEWEYVTRAGTMASRYWGGSSRVQCRYANGADASTDFSQKVTCDDGSARTAPVGHYEPNDFGLHDALGNVWEWVADCWNGSYHGAPLNGRAWESGDCSQRVFRGGAWFNEPRALRSAFRARYKTGYRSNVLGFRVARALNP